MSRTLALSRVYELAKELCDAIDLADKDIGGSRPMKTILGELGPAVDAVAKTPVKGSGIIDYPEHLKRARRAARDHLNRKYAPVGMIPLHQTEHDLTVIKHYLEYIQPLMVEEIYKLLSNS